jgi:peptide/nickel transport system permease protein
MRWSTRGSGTERVTAPLTTAAGRGLAARGRGGRWLALWRGGPPAAAAGRTVFREQLRRLGRDRLGLVMIALAGVIVAVSLLAPVLAPHDPLDIDPTQRLRAPSRQHWLGTDDLGRDVYSRVLYGGRISIRIAAIVVAISVSIGVTSGALAGYVGGQWDQLTMRVTDIFLAFPSLVLAMALSAALGPSVENAAIALGLVWWPSYARLMRGQVLAVKNEPFIEASQAAGASHARVLWRHIAPNSVDPVLVRVTLTGGNAILMSAALGFIGLGAQPPSPEWGLMVSTARRFMTEAWWYPAISGSVIFVTVLVFTVASDAIQEAIHPEGD